MNNRLFVGNLSFHTTEDVIQQAFARYGSVSEVNLVLDRENGRSRGFAFVSMASDEEANTAIQELNGVELDGRQLNVNIAQERRSRSDGGSMRGSERRW